MALIFSFLTLQGNLQIALAGNKWKIPTVNIYCALQKRVIAVMYEVTIWFGKILRHCTTIFHSPFANLIFFENQEIFLIIWSLL